MAALTAKVKEVELVGSFQRGNSEAFCDLVDRYQDRMFSLLQCVTRKTSQIEELLAEVFMRLHDSLQSTEQDFEKSSFPNFVYKVALEVVSEKERQGLLVRDVVLGGNTEQYADQEFKEMLVNAISRLPLEYKQIFWLRDVTGAKLADICEILDLSLTQLRTRLHRARLVLRRNLAAQLDELRDSGVALTIDFHSSDISLTK